MNLNGRRLATSSHAIELVIVRTIQLIRTKKFSPQNRNHSHHRHHQFNCNRRLWRIRRHHSFVRSLLVISIVLWHHDDDYGVQCIPIVLHLFSFFIFFRLLQLNRIAKKRILFTHSLTLFRQRHKRHRLLRIISSQLRRDYTYSARNSNQKKRLRKFSQISSFFALMNHPIENALSLKRW